MNNQTNYMWYIIRKNPLVPGPDMRAAKGGGSGTKGGGVVTDIKFGGSAARIAIIIVFCIPMTGVICDCWVLLRFKLIKCFFSSNPVHHLNNVCFSIPAPNNTKCETL